MDAGWDRAIIAKRQRSVLHWLPLAKMGKWRHFSPPKQVNPWASRWMEVVSGRFSEPQHTPAANSHCYWHCLAQQQRALNFSICRCSLRESLSSNGVDLILWLAEGKKTPKTQVTHVEKTSNNSIRETKCTSTINISPTAYFSPFLSFSGRGRAGASGATAMQIKRYWVCTEIYINYMKLPRESPFPLKLLSHLPCGRLQTVYESTLDNATRSKAVTTTKNARNAHDIKKDPKKKHLLSTQQASMKMMQGWCSLAYPNISRMILADSPMYLSTIADATTLTARQDVKGKSLSSEGITWQPLQCWLGSASTDSCGPSPWWMYKVSLQLVINIQWQTCAFTSLLWPLKSLLLVTASGLSLWNPLATQRFKPQTLMKDAVMLCAIARARSVLPVPGGP